MRPRALFAGLSTLDLEYVCASFPVENDKIAAQQHFSMAGGPALNAAVTFSALGGSARLCTQVGSGVPASIVHNELSRYGVRLIDTIPDREDALPLSSIVINSMNGSRTIVTSEAARESQLDVGDCLGSFGRPMIVLIDSYLLNIAKPIAKWARSKGIPVVFDGDAWQPWMPEILALVDMAIVSEHFTPSGAPVDNQWIDTLQRFGVEHVAVTRGDRSIIWSAGGEPEEVVPPTVDAIDTLGAGDIFHGAFCYYYCARRDFQTALASASRIASLSCTTWGTRKWINIDNAS